MSKRLQVLLSDQEFSALQQLARRDRLTLTEWVRRALSAAAGARTVVKPEMKLKAVRRAAMFSFPTGALGQVLDEIEQGYRG